MRGSGFAAAAVSCVALAVYSWLLFFVAPRAVVEATAFAGVASLLCVLAWVGYVLTTTPPPMTLDEVERAVRSRLAETTRDGRPGAPDWSRNGEDASR